ncbi:MAG: TolC family outer membrane protein [Burkholderiales bacterium]|nr:TolC family outer membrane protein [Burkholderiales bacterium]
MKKVAYHIVSACVALAFAGVGHAADLSSVYQAARSYDATIAAAEASQRAGDEKAAQGRALWLPQVSASGFYQHQTESQNLPVAEALNAPHGTSLGLSAHGQARGYQVTATQALYNVAASTGKAQLQEQAHLADVRFEAAKQDLIVRVAQAYFDVLYAQDNLEFVRAQRDANKEQLAQAKKGFDVGVGTVTDVNEAQASFDASTASEIAAVNALEVKQNAFIQLTGQAADNLAPLATHIVATPPAPDSVDYWLSRAEMHSPDIEAQRGALDIATAEIDKYRALRQPTLSLVGQKGETWDNGGLAALNGSSSQQSSIGIQLNIPLYTGGSTSSKLRESLALRDQAKQQLLATQRGVAQYTKAAFLGVKSGAAQIKALEQALASAQSSLDSTTLGRQVGVRTTLDVLNTQQTLYSTKRDLAQARYSYLISKLQLAQAIGELSDEDLYETNAQLKH